MGLMTNEIKVDTTLKKKVASSLFPLSKVRDMDMQMVMWPGPHRQG